MIYFGQEFGELGMNSEGFSGRDGRTTIFDYWSVDSVRRWRNSGKYDGALLTAEEKKLYTIYQKVMTLCNAEKAISNGLFFDLTYANVNGWRFNEHKQYAFLRKYKNELLLIAVNFDNQPADIAINIPQHAFDYFQMPQLDSYSATELLHGHKENVSLNPEHPTEIRLDAHSGKILKFSL